MHIDPVTWSEVEVRLFMVLKEIKDPRGAVLVEAALSLIVMALLILGLTQELIAIYAQQRHAAIATEITDGPQDITISTVLTTIPSPSYSFAPLSSGALTTFMNNLGNFFVSRASQDRLTAHFRLAYINIDPNTGKISTSPAPWQLIGSAPSKFTTFSGGNCDTDGSLASALDQFATQKLTLMDGYTAVIPGTPPTVDNDPVIGIKLYDVVLGSTNYISYLDFIPFLFVSICSEPQNYIFPQRIVSRFTLVPRRLVN